jgi:hypothetical protein
MGKQGLHIPYIHEEGVMGKWRLIIALWSILTWMPASHSVAQGQDPHAAHGIHPAEAPTKAFQAKLSIPKGIRPGESFAIAIDIQDGMRRQVPEFDLFQEKLMHLILVSDDLAYFSHLHPEYRGNGRFQTSTVLPAAGGYTLFCDYQPAGAGEQISVLKLRMQGTEKSEDAADPNRGEQTLQDLRVRMIVSPATFKANDEIAITFDLKRLDGSPVTGLEPYLGEKGHLVVIKKSAPLTDKDYIHAHAMRGGPASQIAFSTRFPSQGLYKLWCQFNNQGRILTADFWIKVER